jgi:hypothetical protein
MKIAERGFPDRCEIGYGRGNPLCGLFVIYLPLNADASRATPLPDSGVHTVADVIAHR